MKELAIILKILLFFVFVGTYAYHIEPNLLLVKQQNVRLSNWDKKLDGLKVIAVSDLHIGCKFVDINKLNKIVDKINCQNPDIVVLLGDFDSELILNSKIPQAEIVSAMGKIKAQNGVFAVLGNHDYEPKSIIVDILKKSNITLLEDERILTEFNGKSFNIIGVKDLWHHYFNPKITRNLNGVPSILLSHNPDVFPELTEEISLTLCGHTHGGEISLPIIGPLFIPSDYGKKYAKNYIIENNKHMYVTKGIGTLSRFRLLNPPEIVVLNLYKK